MPDAEIIPIGGKARPGRGSRTSPSAAARALAPAEGRADKPPRPTGRGRRTTPPPPDPAAQAGGFFPDDAAPSRATSSWDAPLEPEATRAPEDTPVPEDTFAPGGAGPAPLRGEPVGGSDLERRVAELLAFLRHRLTGDYDVDDFGFDAQVTERLILPVLRPLAEKWFRIDVRGIENVPVDGGALVVSNHSGTLPIDGLMTALVLHDRANRSLRMLAADLVLKTPFLGELARKGGATLANNEDAERMLARGDLVGVWPEGFKGVGKPFTERYKLQRFGRGGFVSAALRVGVPIIPCSIVGAEEIYPMIGNVPALARLLGLPYLPITPFFPWFGLLGLVPLPSKWLIEFGEPIRTDSYGAGAGEDPMLVFNVTDQVRETIQQTLYSLLTQRRGVFR
ncbi:MAG: hypothetical protein QOI06_1136 [Nocardioidaceae bacterium]|jgi:1-acyl-sn-glycerol-3-phosphate acyltransferase|nr:hypothetical protein [Nocardioidaceae bacterium]